MRAAREEGKAAARREAAAALRVESRRAAAPLVELAQTFPSLRCGTCGALEHPASRGDRGLAARLTKRHRCWSCDFWETWQRTEDGYPVVDSTGTAWTVGPHAPWGDVVIIRAPGKVGAPVVVARYAWAVRIGRLPVRFASWIEPVAVAFQVSGIPAKVSQPRARTHARAPRSRVRAADPIGTSGGPERDPIP